MIAVKLWSCREEFSVSSLNNINDNYRSYFDRLSIFSIFRIFFLRLNHQHCHCYLSCLFDFLICNRFERFLIFYLIKENEFSNSKKVFYSKEIQIINQTVISKIYVRLSCIKSRIIEKFIEQHWFKSSFKKKTHCKKKWRKKKNWEKSQNVNQTNENSSHSLCISLTRL